MVQPCLRFAGLNLFTKAGSECRVLVTKASARINARDRTVLHKHKPLLIVEEGTLRRRGESGRRFLKDWPHGGRLQGRRLDFALLSGNYQFRLEPRLTGGLAPPSWLPKLSDVDSRVDPNGLDPDGPTAATFTLSGGIFNCGTEVPVDDWAGNHLGSNPPGTLAAWTELEYTVNEAEIELHRGAGRPVWVLAPPPGRTKILAWIGNVPLSTMGSHGAGGATVLVDHFKWLYQHSRMRPQPITGLAHPVVPKNALNIRSPNSTFCPDGQHSQ